jgi:hypothetical protein
VGVRDFLHQAFGPQFREFVAQGGELVRGGGQSQGLGDMRMKFTGGESPTRREVREARQGLPESQLARVIEFESGDSPPALGLGGLAIGVGRGRRRAKAEGTRREAS